VSNLIQRFGERGKLCHDFPYIIIIMCLTNWNTKVHFEKPVKASAKIPVALPSKIPAKLSGKVAKRKVVTADSYDLSAEEDVSP
jgi:hypothetical protein